MDLLNVEEAAQYLRISVHTIAQYGREGRIPRRTIGRRVLFERGELDRWLLAGETTDQVPASTTA